jgi:hypothetical protein
LHSDADSPKISFMVVEGIAPEENFRHSFPFGQDLLPLEGVRGPIACFIALW